MSLSNYIYFRASKIKNYLIENTGIIILILPTCMIQFGFPTSILRFPLQIRFRITHALQ